ncbi:MAG: hypothetical protein ACLQIB_13330 [Isosphaeraceae bacterium]
MIPRKRQPPEQVDESAESEITIQADGRVFAFGITGPLAAVLATLPTADERMKRLLERISKLHLTSGSSQSSRAQESPSCPNP